MRGDLLPRFAAASFGGTPRAMSINSRREAIPAGDVIGFRDLAARLCRRVGWGV